MLYLHRLAKHGMVVSISRKRNCYDDAVAECFFNSLKNELVYERYDHTCEDARVKIVEFIEAFYSRQRLHQTHEYLGPEQVESQSPIPIRGCLQNHGWLISAPPRRAPDGRSENLRNSSRIFSTLSSFHEVT